MVFKKYQIISLVVSLSIASFGAHTKKRGAPVHQRQTTTVNQSAVAQQAATNLTSFLSRVGIQPAHTSAAPSTQPAASALTKQLLIPPVFGVHSASCDRIVFDKESGTPLYVEVSATYRGRPTAAPTTAALIERASSFFRDHTTLFRITDPGSELELIATESDPLGMTHLRYRQKHQGLPVWGKEGLVHCDPQGRVTSFTGHLCPTPHQFREASFPLDSITAVTIAQRTLTQRSPLKTLPPLLATILDYDGPTAQKIVWYDAARAMHIVWLVSIRSGLSQDWRYFVDARDGTILDAYNAVCSDGATVASAKDLNGITRTFGSYLSSQTSYMIDAAQPMFDAAQSTMPTKGVGTIECLDLRNTDLTSSAKIFYVTSANNTFTDATAVSAHSNAITTYQYFKAVYNRNSVNNKGMSIYSVVHATEKGQGMENAFWTGKIMCYGDGGTYFKPLAGALDVAAHEMAHGVTEFSANLEYKGQSGALNESFSDVFGALVDSANWQLAETIIKDLTTFPSGAMRDLANPHNGGTVGSSSWQPASMSEYQTMTQDNGGVHVNSGIPNHAFYLAAQSLGRAKAGQIWYRALTSYLTRSSQFLDARLATVKSAQDLFPGSTTEVAAVKAAWTGVGVTDGIPDPDPQPDKITGKNWILVTDVTTADPNSLYMAKSVLVNDTDLAPLIKTEVLTRPAVSDTSGIILFVDGDNNLRALYANPKNPQEEIIDTSGIWWSVAIGAGFNAVALTTNLFDTTIYYLDLVTTANSKAIKIRIPAPDGNAFQPAIYADALCFNQSGSALLFDTYNLLTNSTGDTLMDFWNINILDIKSGKMGSAFPPQDDGVSIGNPSFSKNSFTRFTFDYFDPRKNRYAVLAADFNTGDVGVVDSTLTDLGYPTYSGDDKTIAYHTVKTIQSQQHEVVLQMPLAANMLEGTGTPKDYITDATFPVWFVIGGRVTPIAHHQQFSPERMALAVSRAPGRAGAIINYQIVKNGAVTLAVFDIRGRQIATLVDRVQSAGYHTVEFAMKPGSSFAGGTYLFRLASAGNGITQKLVMVK